jgi:predicted DNA binding CopG/RHH family protein
MIKKKQNSNFKYLDSEEKELKNLNRLKHIPETERNRIVHDFQNAYTKQRTSITIRMDSRDVALLKNIAVDEGMPYQTLLGSIIHKYVNGNLVDLKEARKVLK